MSKVYVETTPVNNDLWCELSIRTSDSYELLDQEGVEELIEQLKIVLAEMTKES